MNELFHEMILEKIRDLKVEEWYCSTCGRRLLVQRIPTHRMITLKVGDKDVRHDFRKSDLLKVVHTVT